MTQYSGPGSQSVSNTWNAVTSLGGYNPLSGQDSFGTEMYDLAGLNVLFTGILQSACRPYSMIFPLSSTTLICLTSVPFIIGVLYQEYNLKSSGVSEKKRIS